MSKRLTRLNNADLPNENFTSRFVKELSGAIKRPIRDKTSELWSTSKPPSRLKALQFVNRLVQKKTKQYLRDIDTAIKHQASESQLNSKKDQLDSITRRLNNAQPE